MGVLDFSRPALGKLAILAEDAGRCEPPNAEKGYAVRRDSGIHGSPFRGKVPGAGTPRHSLVTVRRGPRQSLAASGGSLLPAALHFWGRIFSVQCIRILLLPPSVRPRLIGFLPVGRFSFAARRYACIAF